MLTLISFACVILIVVSIHELGHYLAARMFGVGVIRFSVGFGKPLWKYIDTKGTEWVLAPIPLGGYVQMLDNEKSRQGLPKFANAKTMEEQKHWQRIIIYAAGPLANMLLSVVIMIFLLSGGEVGLRPVVGTAQVGGEAALAGIRQGDELRSVNARETLLWRHVELALIDAAIAGDDITIIDADDTTYNIPQERVAVDEIERGIGQALGLLPIDNFILPQVAAVLPNSPADIGGLLEGDEIVAINNRIIDSWRNALTIIQQNPGNAAQLVVWREGEALTLNVTLAAVPLGSRQIGQLGISPVVVEEKLAAALTTIRYSPLGLVGAAFSQSANDIWRTFGFVKLMFSGAVSADNVSGPIGIATQSGKAAASGIGGWLRFVAIISISLAVLNLLPLPVLDGGQILLSVVQWTSRRDLPVRFIQIWNAGGVAVLLTLMVWTVFNDIMRLL